MMKSEFTGLRKASIGFTSFSIQRSIKHPFDETLFLLVIYFGKQNLYGLCVWNTETQNFREKPGNTEWFDLEEMENDFGVKLTNYLNPKL